MCTLFYLFIYYIYVCLQNVNVLANKTLQHLEAEQIFVSILNEVTNRNVNNSEKITFVRRNKASENYLIY